MAYIATSNRHQPRTIKRVRIDARTWIKSMYEGCWIGDRYSGGCVGGYGSSMRPHSNFPSTERVNSWVWLLMRLMVVTSPLCPLLSIVSLNWSSENIKR